MSAIRAILFHVRDNSDTGPDAPMPRLLGIFTGLPGGFEDITPGI
jgi:hypothetical protein